MMNFNPQQLAMMLLQKNPQITNSPQGQEFLRIMQSGDSKAGEQMAKNLCQTYGVTPDQALQKAKRFFGMP